MTTSPGPWRSAGRCARRITGRSRQRDTYFNVASGGLKLREEIPGDAHLIQFERSDEPQQHESRYRLVAIENARGLRVALDAALGVRAVVAKRRRLHVWREVRIHLDEVDGLGTFAITDARLLSRGYANQLLSRPTPTPSHQTIERDPSILTPRH
jgi:adenylate cyclase class IV